MEGDVDSITWNPVTTPLIMSQKEDKGRPADSGLHVDCCRRSEGLEGDCGGGKRMESEIERLGRYSPCQ